ncbi:ATP/GTP-binding protein [Streptomyces rochei]|uniref:ATP/GTP-binding protein n=1 Tax=Streptomyces rochei TaxID=1928 RepID=UPI002ACD8BF3|nr:ATP/GTP-binding protein [Streptomyces rochei]WQC10355.1 ATP/GTP-binding protein [Streptomyces rochei]WQC17320.1 ATP/GTP-binding protein [Streptomyces rochei]
MLKRWCTVVTAALLASAVIPVKSFADEDPRGSGGVHCTKYTCQVEVDAPGQPGHGQAGGSGSASAPGKSDSSGGNYTDKRVCTYKLADPQPPAGSLDWEGHEPGDGAVYEQTCGWEGLEGNTIVRMVWLAEPPEQETIDPAVLAQRAVDSMTLLGPDIASPRATGRYTVGVPMWMWVNQSATTYGPNTASASAGGVTVTAIAKVSKIVWQMGDGSTVTCAGPGTPYKGSSSMAESPTCGHRYSATSADAPDGRYSVTATSTWTIDWQGGGQSGQLEEIRQSDIQVAVGELQVVR